MSVLFLSAGETVHSQDKLLMQSLLGDDYPFLYACPVDSNLALMGNSCNIPLVEMPKGRFERFFALRRLLKTFPVKFVYVLDLQALNLAKTFKRFTGAKYKIIAGHHSRVNVNDQKNFSSPDCYDIKALLANKIDVLFLSSLDLYNSLQKQCVPTHSIALLPYVFDNEQNPASLGQGQFLDRLEIDNYFTFLVESPLESESGIPILLDALVYLKQLLSDTDRKFQVQICGSGSLFHTFIEKATELEVDKYLAFFGDHQSALFYSNAHTLICPATGGEGNYREIITGWRASLPIISSDLSPHTNLLLTGRREQSAFIYPHESGQTLAKCMCEIMYDAKLRENLVRVGNTLLPNFYHTHLASQFIHALQVKQVATS